MQTCRRSVTLFLGKTVGNAFLQSFQHFTRTPVMARFILHPLIRSASGRMGDLVFYTAYSRQLARRYVIPRNPDTPAQNTVRSRFKDAVRRWQSLDDRKKALWREKAAGSASSGYNLFIREYLLAASQNDIPQSRLSSPATPLLLQHPSVSFSARNVPLKAVGNHPARPKKVFTAAPRRCTDGILWKTHCCPTIRGAPSNGTPSFHS